jgi:hypothetical protein
VNDHSEQTGSAQMSGSPAEVIQRLNELEGRWNTRLANQRQVIENLSLERDCLLRIIGEVEKVAGFIRPMLDPQEVSNERERRNYQTILEALNKALGA